MDLMFTHRTSHGDIIDGTEVEHSLHDSELAAIQSEFPTVFSEPSFPISRP